MLRKDKDKEKRELGRHDSKPHLFSHLFVFVSSRHRAKLNSQPVVRRFPGDRHVVRVRFA